MSDIPQGPGWWQASDGKWYPMGQATLQPLFDHRSPVVRRKQRSSGPRALLLMVLAVVAVAGYVYGPRYYPKVEEMLGMDDPPTAPATDPVTGVVASPVELPASAAEIDPELLMGAMKAAWLTQPAEDRHAMCQEVPGMGLDQAVRDFLAGWDAAAAARQSSVPTPSKAAVVELIDWGCDEQGGGG
jgi:hypothetical protein